MKSRGMLKEDPFQIVLDFVGALLVPPEAGRVRIATLSTIPTLTDL
jgi:hypothetical protein